MADKPAGQTEDPTVATTDKTNAGTESEPTTKAPEGAEGEEAGAEPGGQGAEKRIAQLSRLKNRYKSEADHWKNIAAKFATIDNQTTAANVNQIAANPATNPSYPNEEVERAFNVLRQRGVATVNDLEQFKNQVELRSKWDKAHLQNEQRYNAPGSKFPHYDPEEIEQYAKEKGIADPNAAYRDMYFDDIVDAMKSETRGRPSKAVTTEKPTRSTEAGKEPLTLENFRAKLAGPDGQSFYEELSKSPAKFDALMAELAK
jgi:hypothetical protein